VTGALHRLTLAAALLAPACDAGVHSFGFLPATLASVGPAATAAAIADFDGDGRADLALAGAGGVVVLPGMTSGAFGARRPGPQVTTAVALAAGDFDGDGRADLAALTSGTPPQVSLLRNAGGTLGAPGTGQAVDVGSYTLAAGHLTPDRQADLVVGTTDLAILFGPGVRVLLGVQGSPTGFRDADTPRYSAMLPDRPLRQVLALADVNGDAARVADLVFLTGGATGAEVMARPGNGDGAFAMPPLFSVRSGLAAVALATGDVDGDGRSDVLVAEGKRIRLLLGRGEGKFREPLDYDVGLAPAWIGVADVDGDGRMDLVAASDQQVAVRLNASL
jgi:hypothetical protein